MDYEFQLHPPHDLLEGAANPWEDPISLIWKLENTPWGEHRDQWGWTVPCSCGEDPAIWTQEGGYQCWKCWHAGPGS